MSATTIILSKSPASSAQIDALARPATAQVVATPGQVSQAVAKGVAVHVPAATLLVAAFAWVSAFLLQFDLAVPRGPAAFMIRALPLVLLLKAVVLWMTGVFRIVWAYVGIADLFTISVSYTHLTLPTS